MVLGILLGRYVHFSLLLSILLTLISIGFLGFLLFKQTHRKFIVFGATTLFTTLCIGILAVSLWQPRNRTNHYTHQTFQKQHTWRLKVREVLKANTFSDRYVGILYAMDDQKVSGKVILNFSVDTLNQKYSVDDELLFYGEFDSVRPPINPNQFDYRAYLKGLGIYHQIRLNTANHFVLENSSKTIYGVAAAFRNTISAKLREANFGKDELGIIQALLLGQRNDISEATYTNYKNAGAVHILAVSGLHIGILLLLLDFFLRPIERLPKGKTLKLVTIVALLWGFAFLAGLSASVVRAVTMFSFVAYALYLNRPSNTFNILALSMFAILLVFNPMLLFQVGFQMSYAAVIAIVRVYPLLQRLWFPKNKIVLKVWQLLSVSIAAQLGVLPISLFYFHQFPGLFFVSNLLIVPFLGLILGMGILVIVLALLNSLPAFLVDGYDSLIRWMNTIIEWVAQQEAFIFINISFDRVQLVLSYLMVIGFLILYSKVTFKRTAVFLCSVIGFQLWFFYSIHITNKKEVLFLAHQTKNSILIHQTGNALSVLSYNKEAAKRIITDYKVAERIKTIEHRPLQNSYKFKNKNIIVIDSFGSYISKKGHYLLLTQSPKINLERLFDSIRPKQVIADGSNYKSYVKRWKTTCDKRKIPFHYTGEKGIFYFK
ncbi:DNA internalization-related competence protein ComEC/Rec2 [hydrothermal vent metagenome]|uniref:DNA internalization-related competence protein ComEC/Rec2 n=1 Tax=hydrothermal vent metagenome TaxID=652676 RepID=A0A3B0TQS7_9ZZZZ